MKPSSKNGVPDTQNPGGNAFVPAGSLRLNLYYRLPLFAFCLFIFWQSSFSFLDSPPLFPHDDKLMHMGAYAVMAFLTARNLKQERPLFSRTKLKVLAILFASLYGLTDEIHQAFVPLREASIWDFVADILGSIMGACFYLDVLHHRKKKDISAR